MMLTLKNYERAEEIADAMDEQDALSVTLYNILTHQLDPEEQRLAGALINSMRYCRNRAALAAEEIARSNSEEAA